MRSSVAPERVRAPRNALLDAAFKRADLQQQLRDFSGAARDLRALAARAPDEPVKARALARLVDVECERGRADAAARALRAAVASSRRSESGELSAEVSAARTRLAFALRDGAALERAFRDVVGASATTDEARRAVARAAAFAAVFRYFVHDIAGAIRAGDLAYAALARAPLAPPFVRAHVLMTLGCTHWHVPERLPHAGRFTADGLALALEHGMVETAHQALYNLLHFAVYCDEPPAAAGARVAFDAFAGLRERPHASADALLDAVAAAVRGDASASLAAIEVARRAHSAWTFDLAPSTATLHARLLFRARRYREAERTAATAVRLWERSGLRGDGTALRVRAEALDALGDTRAAATAIEQAVASLEGFTPLHHLFAAYAAAYRLTARSAYRERLAALHDAAGRGRAVRRGLSARELQVARLAAAGRTNPAIARELGISRKTVANHLTSVFEHLGIRARWQLAPECIEAFERESLRPVRVRAAG